MFYRAGAWRCIPECLPAFYGLSWLIGGGVGDGCRGRSVASAINDLYKVSGPGAVHRLSGCYDWLLSRSFAARNGRTVQTFGWFTCQTFHMSGFDAFLRHGVGYAVGRKSKTHSLRFLFP